MIGTATLKRNARVALLGVAVLLVALVGSMILWQSGAQAQVDPYASESPTVLPTLITNSGSPSPTPTPVPSDTVLGERQTREPTPPPQVLGERQPTNELPFTGADLTLFVATGLASIGTGAVIVRRSRSKRGHQE